MDKPVFPTECLDSKQERDLPQWVQAAMVGEELSQPWKKLFGTQDDDPNFAQEKDTILFYDKVIKVCYGEGSMAA